MSSNLPSVQQGFFRRLGLIFGLATGAVIVVGAIAYTATQQLIYANEEVNKTYESLGKLEEVLGGLKDAETGQRGFSITGDPAFLQPYAGAERRVELQLVELTVLFADTPSQGDRLDQIAALSTAKFKEIDEVVALKKTGDNAAVIRRVSEGRGKRLMDEIRVLVDAAKSEELTLLRARQERTNIFVVLETLAIAALILIVLLILTYAYQFVGDEIERRKETEQKLEEARSQLKYSMISSADEIRGYLDRGEEKDKILATLSRLTKTDD